MTLRRPSHRGSIPAILCFQGSLSLLSPGGTASNGSAAGDRGGGGSCDARRSRRLEDAEDATRPGTVHTALDRSGQTTRRDSGRTEASESERRGCGDHNSPADDGSDRRPLRGASKSSHNTPTEVFRSFSRTNSSMPC